MGQRGLRVVIGLGTVLWPGEDGSPEDPKNTACNALQEPNRIRPKPV